MKKSRKVTFRWLAQWEIAATCLVLLNVLCIVWIINGEFDVFFKNTISKESSDGIINSLPEATESGSESTGTAEGIIDETEEIHYPEGAIIINSYEEKMAYFRNWYLKLLCIPDELEDSCEVSVNLPELNGSTSKDGWLGYVNQMISHGRDIGPQISYRKNGQYYRLSGNQLYWNESFSKESECKSLYLENIHVGWVRYNLSKTDELSWNKKEGYLNISGTLSQEIYSDAREAFDRLSVKSMIWDGRLEAAGFWHHNQSGRVFGSMKGEIYLIDSLRGGTVWICLEGMDPIKVKPESSDFLSEALTPIEGADFDAEKDKALAKLSFDLMVESLSEK